MSTNSLVKRVTLLLGMLGFTVISIQGQSDKSITPRSTNRVDLNKRVILNKSATDDENSRSMGLLLLFKLNGNVVQRSLDQVSGDPFNLVPDTLDLKVKSTIEFSNQKQKNNTNRRKSGNSLNNLGQTEYDSKFLRIILPNSTTNTNNVAGNKYYYGYLFNEHRGNDIEPLNTLFIIETTFVTNRPTKIWIDYNNNFDFTDEVFFEWKYPTENVKVPFPNQNSQSNILISKFPYYKFRQFSTMQDTAIKLLSNGRAFVGSKECLKVVRENIIYGDFTSHKDTVFVGIQDVNLNGRFTDKNIDRILVGSSKNDEFSASLAQPILEKNQLVWMGHLYDVTIPNVGAKSKTFEKSTSVKSNNSNTITEQFNSETELDSNAITEIILSPSLAKKNDLSLLINQKFPRFRFEYLVKKEKANNNKSKSQKNKCKSVRSIKSESKLIYVWSAENESFISDSLNLHRWARLNPNTQLIMLNFGGSTKYLSSYNNRYQIESIQGLLTSKNVKKMKLQSMPQYFLLDKKNRIKFIGHSIYQLNDLSQPNDNK